MCDTQVVLQYKTQDTGLISSVCQEGLTVAEMSWCVCECVCVCAELGAAELMAL